MYHTLWGVALVYLTTTAVTPALAQEETSAPDRPQIRIIGSATRTVRPDYATITLGITSEGATPREAGQRLALLVDSLRRDLQNLGIPRDSIVNPDQSYWGRNRMEKTFANRTVAVPNGPPGVTYQKQDTIYRGHDALRASIHDLSKVGPVIDAAFAHGVVEISELTYRATNTTAARDDVLRAAAKDARAQATAIAEASGARLGRLLSLSTQPDARLDPFSQTLSLRDAVTTRQSVDGGTQITSPALPLAATIYARWELVPAQ